ncbi:MAG: UDP-N-acetylmuramoyl-L-alanine--D-glutamate ligase, partial [Clostridia bacterium]|nr:UDP-N-acetylmuramoyl-L-alanine--D-glutamate ligase [Clostridia bacterium]
MLFERQTFLVAGLSRSGISAAEYLVSRGARVFIYDDVQDENVLSASAKLAGAGCVIVGKDELYDKVPECDILVLSPGIPVDHPLPVAFRKHGKSIIGETELGALALRCPVV